MSAQGMPQQILALFAPRLPLDYVPPVGGYGKKPVYTGISDFSTYFETTVPPSVLHFETPRERKDRKKKEKLEEHRKKQEELITAYDPHKADCSTKNPFATLFVARLSYETTEKKLKKEFECFGPIRRVKIITDFNGKSRGYAFIEYETEEDLKTAYKQGDGKKIDGRRVLVDVERSRTVPGWIPRRLGGGRGPPRFAEPKKKKALSTTVSTLGGGVSSSTGGRHSSYSSSHMGGPSSSRSSWQGNGGGTGSSSYRGSRGSYNSSTVRGSDSRGAGSSKTSGSSAMDRNVNNRYSTRENGIGGSRSSYTSGGGGGGGQWDDSVPHGRPPGNRDYYRKRSRSRERNRRYRSRSREEKRY